MGTRHEAALRETIETVDPERFDYETQLESLVDLLEQADAKALLERTAIGVLLRDHAHQHNLPNRRFGLRPRGLQYLYGLLSTQPPTGDATVPFRDVGIQFARVRDAYLLSKATQYLYAETGSFDEYRAELGLVERELDTGRFAEPGQPRDLAQASYAGFDGEMVDAYGFTIPEAVDFATFLQETLQANAQPLAMAVAQFFAEHREAAETMMTQDATEQKLPGGVNLLAEDQLFRDGLDIVDEIYDELGGLDQIWLDSGSLVRSLPDDHDPSRFVSFLRELSIEVGVPDRSRNPEFRGIDELNPVHASPLLEIGGRYFLTTGDNLERCLAETFYYGLRSAMTRIGRQDEFDQRWGQAAEDWVHTQLRTIADPDRLLSNVTYRYQGTEYESDFVLLGDDSLLVLEVKTKKLPVNTRTGDLNILQSDVDAGIGTAYEQAARFIRAVLGNETLQVDAAEGEYAIDRERFDLFQPVVVLRDSYDHLATLDYQTVLELEDMHPYVVDFYALERIIELLPDQDTFITYVTERRQEQRAQQWFSNDEIDYLGRFMANNNRIPGHGGDTLRRLKDYSGVLDDLAAQVYGE